MENNNQYYENFDSNNNEQHFSEQNLNESLHSTRTNASEMPDNPNRYTKKTKSKNNMFTIVLCVILSSVLGFAGGMVASKFSKNSQNSLNISSSVSSSSDSSESAKTTVAAVSSAVGDSVVEITTEVVSTDNWMRQYITEGAGSGVIIDSDGYIITNNHVISGAQKITVTLKNASSYDATLVATDSKQDIALLKIEESNLQAVVFGDSSSLQVGEEAIAIGNPLGQLGGTVTEGIISALDREISIEGEPMTLLQTDSAINPGNSGGGLFNSQGEFIGLVVAKSSGSNIEGLGFAIPSNIVKNVVTELSEYGYVRGRVDLKISLVDITSLQSAMMHGVTQIGVYVSDVEKDSNAEKAGLKSGARVIAVNSTTVNSTEEINKILNNLNVGDTITFTVQQNNQKSDISFVLEEYTL